MSDGFHSYVGVPKGGQKQVRARLPPRTSSIVVWVVLRGVPQSIEQRPLFGGGPAIDLCRITLNDKRLHSHVLISGHSVRINDVIVYCPTCLYCRFQAMNGYHGKVYSLLCFLRGLITEV